MKLYVTEADTYRKLLLDARTDAAVDVVFDMIFDLLADEPEAFDQVVLAWIASRKVAAQLHVGVLLACLRLFGAESLPHWKAARDAAARALHERGEDAGTLLRGLPQEEPE